MNNETNRMVSFILVLCAITMCVTMAYVSYAIYQNSRAIDVLVANAELRDQRWEELQKANPKVRVPTVKEGKVEVPEPTVSPRKYNSKPKPTPNPRRPRWPWSKP